jgi:protein-tyrosine phosphatase
MTTKFQSILFLCTGNYYRSRFAEILFNHRAMQDGLNWRAQSRGLRLNPDNVGPISGDTVAWLRQHGAELPKTLRLPMSVSEVDLDGADHIVAIKKAEHLPLLQAQFPKYVDRVEFWNVHDLDCAGPDEALHNLEREVLRLMERMCS